MHPRDLTRIRELRDAAQNSASQDAYFKDFDASIEANPVKRKHFVDIEADLQSLDPIAWSWLKNQVKPLFEKRDPTRGWQAAFDRLNEAKGYRYLIKLGCTDVEFICKASGLGGQTPDLKGNLGSGMVLCEVKTINPSEDEVNARRQSVARGIQCRLPEPFFDKLESTLKKAKGQMIAYDPGQSVRRFAYVVVNFNDNLNEHVEIYIDQLRAFSASTPVSDIEIEFDVKPAFYSASA